MLLENRYCVLFSLAKEIFVLGKGDIQLVFADLRLIISLMPWIILTRQCAVTTSS